MKKTKLFLMLHHNKYPMGLPWAGYESATDGLVVCRNPQPFEDEYKPGSYWQVIHKSSGYVLPYCQNLPLRRVALTVASLLGAFMNWTQTDVEIYEQSKRRIRPRDMQRVIERAKEI